MITGIDLIQEQIKVAQGERLKFSQEDIQFKGHSIECRINAEDPFANFRPGPGRVTTYLAPGGPNVRMDSHLYPDYLVRKVFFSGHIMTVLQTERVFH